MVNLFDELELKGGRLFNTNSIIWLDVDIKHQLLNLIEDIARIEFEQQNAFIDIGYYPTDFEVTDHHYFCVRVIVSENWDLPYYEAKIKSIENLKNEIEISISMVTNFGTGISSFQ